MLCGPGSHFLSLGLQYDSGKGRVLSKLRMVSVWAASSPYPWKTGPALPLTQISWHSHFSTQNQLACDLKCFVVHGIVNHKREKNKNKNSDGKHLLSFYYVSGPAFSIVHVTCLELCKCKCFLLRGRLG